MNSLPEALRPELVAPITEAIIAADPTAEPQVIEAARTGMGMAASQVAQVYWPEVTLLWVVIGTGPHALVRYVACPPDGSLHVLTSNTDAFDLLSKWAVLELTDTVALEYALLYLEVTRGMDQATAIVVSEQSALAHMSRIDLVKAVLFGERGLSVEQRVQVLERLQRVRYTETSQVAIYAALDRIVSAMTDDTDFPEQHTANALMAAGFSSAEIRHITRLHRLPPVTLTTEEREQLLRCLEALTPDIQPNYGVLLSESQVFGRSGFIESRLNGCPVVRMGQSQTGYFGGMFPEVMLGVQRCPRTGDVLRMDAEWGVLLTCEPPTERLAGASIPPERWDGMEDFQLMRNGEPVVYSHAVDGHEAVTKDRHWFAFEWNATLHDIDGFGRATPLMRFSQSKGQWIAFEEVATDIQTSTSDWALTPAVRRVLSCVSNGPRVRASGRKFLVETLVCRGESVDLCQLLVAGDGTVHADWSPLI